MKEKVFDKLYSEYDSFTAPRTTLRDPILDIVLQHGLISAKVVIEELEELGFSFNRSSIYKQIKSLTRDGILKEQKLIEKVAQLSRIREVL
jgi:Fe2+ or Zn2+ uptake regulation protein